MTRMRPLSVTAAAASALLLAGCAGADAAQETGDGVVQVVASTNVYGQIAEEIGGTAVEVTSIVTSSAQDPHSYESSAQDQLVVSRADLVIENGGGYDAFIDGLIEASGSEAHVITAAEFSHDWPGNAGHEDETSSTSEPEEAHDEAEGDDHEGEHTDHGHVEGFNEHVWYDAHTMEHLAESIAEELTELAPDAADDIRTNLDAFVAGIAEIESALAGLEAAADGAKVFVTEPVPGYLVSAAGLDDITPGAFSEAVEEGQDVPPATLLESARLLETGDVRAVITNTQTGGAETEQVVADAESRGIPVVEFAETLPEGQTYLSWMDENVAALGTALGM